MPKKSLSRFNNRLTLVMVIAAVVVFGLVVLTRSHAGTFPDFSASQGSQIYEEGFQMGCSAVTLGICHDNGFVASENRGHSWQNDPASNNRTYAWHGAYGDLLTDVSGTTATRNYYVCFAVRAATGDAKFKVSVVENAGTPNESATYISPESAATGTLYTEAPSESPSTAAYQNFCYQYKPITGKRVDHRLMVEQGVVRIDNMRTFWRTATPTVN